MITKSVIAVHQLPPNSKTGEQSDPFTCLRWTGKKLDSEWNEIAGEEAETTVVIPIRMGKPKESNPSKEDAIRPGKLAAKDFDNLDVEPEDLGADVDTEGNAIFLEPNAKVGRGWAIMEESLRKSGFKPEISGRGVATDFEGMVAHFKTVEGAKYIAKQGKDKGKEVTPTNLVCDRIHTYPYDKKKGAAGTATAAAKTTSTAAASGKTNGAAADAGADDAQGAAKTVFGNLSAEFKKEVPVDKDVPRATFQRALTKELMRQKIASKVQKSVMELVKDDEKLGELAMLLVDQPGAFTTDGENITFGA